MVANIAQQILNENNYTLADISIANLEYLINNAADYINLMADTSIPNIAAAALTATENEILVVKTLSALMIRAYKDRGPNISPSSLNITTILQDPQYQLFSKIVDTGIARLKTKQGVAFVVATDDADLV